MELSEKLKGKALEVAERHIMMAIDDVYEIADVVVADTENPLDDTLLAGLKMLKGELKKLADKVAPEVVSAE